jgi:hypothetical protein
MDRSYIAETDAQRARLKALVERLSGEDLMRPMDAGWTVAGVLAHIAQWDSLALYLVNKFESGVEPYNIGWGREDVDWINGMSKPMCLAMPPHLAAQFALQIAEQTDARMASLSDELLEKIIAVGPPFNISRAVHRKEHLDDIARYV